MLNVLIAIVSDSYDTAMADASELYHASRLDQVSGAAELSTRFHAMILHAPCPEPQSNLHIPHPDHDLRYRVPVVRSREHTRDGGESL